VTGEASFARGEAMNINWDQILQSVTQTATNVGLKLLGALAVFIVGRWLIHLAVRLVSAALEKQKIDPTILRYVASIINVALNILLVVAILGYFGVETTSFAALVAGIGLAVGAAWAGLLSNFAAGVFVIVLRPFKVGDFIQAGGVTGTVVRIGLFATEILTPDNVHTIVGNAKVFGDNIMNYSASDFRRVDRTAQLAHGVDPADAVARLKARLAAIPNVKAVPAPDVEILDFNPMGPVLAVRPYTHTDHYWQVYFDTNRVIKEEFGAAGYPVPEQHMVMRQVAAKA
jgi:small conductance mechanosensitive channel